MFKRNRGYEYFFNVREIQSQLSGGANRIVESTVSMSGAFFPDRPTFGDELWSSYGMESVNGELEKEYREEIEAIRENIKKHSQEIGLGVEQDAKKRFRAGLSLQSMTISIWDSYAVPVRLKNSHIFRIWSSPDLLGTPMIKSMPIATYLRLVAMKTAEDKAKIKKLNSHLGVCVTVLGIVVLIFLLLVL